MASAYPSAVYTSGAVRLTFPYEPQLIEGLKLFPAHARDYSPATRVWTVREPHVESAIALLLAHFPHSRVVGRASHSTPPPRSPSSGTAGAHATLFLLPSAPPEVVDAAYRALVKLHHPDRLPAPQRAAGTEQMKAINAAYAQLAGERRAS